MSFRGNGQEGWSNEFLRVELGESLTMKLRKLKKVNRKSAHKDEELHMHPYLKFTFTPTHAVIGTGFGSAAASCFPAVCGRHS